MAELEQGTRFQPVLADPIADPSQVQRIVLLSGKIYYELIKERQARNLDNAVAFIRIEEISPFPFKELVEVLDRYGGGSAAKECYFVQEEPRNQGVWPHVKERVEVVLGGVMYRGRKESAVPAPGIGRMYAAQQKRVIELAFEGL